MPTAVLVHGGFHGGWCWSKVARPLREQGWDVHAPSLTGVADRAHLATADVGAMTHVQDIVNLIEFEELQDVILCGHSAGGHTITGVAEAIPERIAHLVYLDATVPESGQSVNDILGDDSGAPQMFRELAAAHDGVSIPPTVFSASDFGVIEPADAAWVTRRLTSHPLRCFEEPIFFGERFESVARKTFVRSERFPAPYGARMIDRFEHDPAWTAVRWDVGHDTMVSVPHDVVSLLIEAAQPPAG